MNVNYMGVVHTLKATMPILVKQKSGYIMVTNSIAGFAGKLKLQGAIGRRVLQAALGV